MSLLANIANVWKNASNALFKKSGTWLPVRRVYIKKNDTWVQAYGRNNFIIYALGLNQQIYPSANKGMWENGAYVYNPGILYDTDGNPITLPAGGRGYNLVTFDKWGNGSSFYNFDTLSDYNSGTSSEGNRMVTILNALPAGQLFCLFSWDEPQKGHLGMNGFDIIDSVVRVGGSVGVFGQPMFYRGAYVLLAKVGTGAYLETYVGDEYGDGSVQDPAVGPNNQPGDGNSAIKLSFQIYNNDFNTVSAVVGDGSPHFSLYALGLWQTVYPRQLAGLLINGLQIYTLGPNWTNYLGSDIRAAGEPWPPVNATSQPVIRSYNLVLFNADGSINPNTYGCDAYVSPPDANIAAFKAVIDALPNGQMFALFSFDIPGAHTAQMAPIIAELGGNSAAFTAGTMPPHSAYMLIGTKGSTPFYEGAAGSPETGAANDGYDAGLRKRFTIKNGVFSSIT